MPSLNGLLISSKPHGDTRLEVRVKIQIVISEANVHNLFTITIMTSLFLHFYQIIVGRGNETHTISNSGLNA